MSRILIVEDEESIAELEKDYLELSGFEVEIENNGETGLKRGMEEDFDLLILDLMLPGVDGFEICKKIREATMEKVPYMLVVGDRDMEGQTVSVRMRSGEDLGAMSCVQFQALLAEDVRTKAIK